MKFYYNYVARLIIPDEVNSEIDSFTFGKIFHYSAELLYEDLTEKSKVIGKEDIEKMLHDKVKIQNYVDAAFEKLFFRMSSGKKPEYNGMQLINSRVIASYLLQLLRNDLPYAPFELVAMEQKVEEILVVDTAGGMEVRIGGVIDRIDCKDGILRIVDYKTGGSPQTPVNMEQLFTPAENRPSYIFQTFLYAAIMSRMQKLKVAPALLYIHRSASESYSPVVEMRELRRSKISIDDFSIYEEEFRERLQMLLKEIYDLQEPFTQTPYTAKCQYCNFKGICDR
jgi:ATP-dependent helicase/DNAse subunit B